MAVAISPRSAAVAYLVFLLVALASSAVIDRNKRSSQLRYVDNGDTALADEVIGVDVDGVDDTNYRRALVILKRILAKAQSPESTQLMTPFRKRTCYFNAGMSHSCDYKELLTSMDEANYWSSDMTPGRRRKRHSRRVVATPLNPALPLPL